MMKISRKYNLVLYNNIMNVINATELHTLNAIYILLQKKVKTKVSLKKAENIDLRDI